MINKIWSVGRWVVLVAVLLLVGYAAGKWGEPYASEWIAYNEAVKADPDKYALVGAVELACPNMTVLTIEDYPNTVGIAVYYDPTTIAKDDRGEVFLIQTTNILALLRSTYPDKGVYSLMFTQRSQYESVDGLVSILLGALEYQFSTEGLDRFLAGESLDDLRAAGQHYIVPWMFQGGINMGRPMEREPGYVWPWE